MIDNFLLIEKSERFATLLMMISCGDNLSVILKSLEHDMKILLKWFKLNPLKANLEKF